MSPARRMRVVWTALGVGIWMMMTAAIAVDPDRSLSLAALLAALMVGAGTAFAALIIAGVKWAAPRDGE